MKRTQQMLVLLMAALMALSACGRHNSGTDGLSVSDGAQEGSAAETVVIDTEGIEIKAGEASPGGVNVTLNGTSADVVGTGASFSDGVLTITAAGNYNISGTLTNGRILVNAKDCDVTLTLNGASVTCTYGSPIYIYKSARTTVNIVRGSENLLADGASYTFADSFSSEVDEEPNACLYSKSDLVISGEGKLTVLGNYNNGITGKDTLLIENAVLAVRAANHGINGKDNLTVKSADITVNAGGDAIRSTQDTESALGWIVLTDAVMNLTAGEDGIQAETTLTISGGSYVIETGGGSAVSPSDAVSAKAVKAGGDLTIGGAAFHVNASDDAFHANGNLTVLSGTFFVSTGDDGFHADEKLSICGGDITVAKSYEGLEGAQVEISGGAMTLTASDDGINAAGGVDGSGFGGMQDRFGGSSDYYIQITGGTVVVNADGDGIDSNGNVTMTGGTLVINGPTSGGNGAVDYEGDFYLDGGILIAAGSAQMAQTPDNPAQNVLSVTWNQGLDAGTYIQIKGGGYELVFRVSKSMQNLIVSSPELKTGVSYAVSYGGSYTGAGEQYGVCTGGSYTGGTALTTLTVSNVITTYGSVGMGGTAGGGWIGGTGPGGSPGEGRRPW